MTKKCMLITFGFILLICSLYMPAQGVPEEVSSKLMIKIISFDKNLSRMASPIRIGVTEDKMLQALNAIKTIQISGKAFTVAKIGGPAEVGQFNVIYIGAAKEGQMEKYASAAASAKVMVISETKSGVEKGAGVGFFVQDGKPKIAVAPANAAAQGSEFPDNFLKVSMVIGEMK